MTKQEWCDKQIEFLGKVAKLVFKFSSGKYLKTKKSDKILYRIP